MIGDSANVGSITLHARLGFRFAGVLPPAEVRRELEEATVFLQHSLDYQGWYEGFGVSLTEAMAMETPAIVSDCGGLVDQVIAALEAGDATARDEALFPLHPADVADLLEQLAEDQRAAEADQLDGKD